ncbi:MAG TPA: hypothetical protein VFV08_02900 [Puia sp.]|nr:hypothetical protein [Puia sp.]
MKRYFKCILAGFFLYTSSCIAQNNKNWMLEKMPADLETEYALSALPPHLREDATVYLLDPTKGYYLARKGTNGFSAFLNRTEWERGQFYLDSYEPISFDMEGSKAYLTPFFEVAAMRASGKYSAAQVKDSVVQRVKDGRYRPASRPGISYMLSPLLRVDHGSGPINQVMPHYMFYAPYLDDKDIGGGWVPGGYQPFAVSSGPALDKAHSIFNFIIIAAGETEKAKILKDNKDLLTKLAAYKSYLKVDLSSTTAQVHHHH